MIVKTGLLQFSTTLIQKKGSKAFTYFSVVSKNWFIAEVKKTSKKAKEKHT